MNKTTKYTGSKRTSQLLKTFTNKTALANKKKAVRLNGDTSNKNLAKSMQLGKTQTSLQKSTISSTSNNERRKTKETARSSRLGKILPTLKTNIYDNPVKKSYTTKAKRNSLFESKSLRKQAQTPSKTYKKKLSISFRSSASDNQVNKDIYNSTPIDIKKESKMTEVGDLLFGKESKLLKSTPLTEKNEPKKELNGPSPQAKNKKQIKLNPLIKKQPESKREFTSVRASLKVQYRSNKPKLSKPKSPVRKSFGTTSKLSRGKPGQKRNPSICRITRPPSINTINTSKQRAKSVTNTVRVSIDDSFRKEKNIVTAINSKVKQLPPFDNAKAVIKDYGPIRAFVVNTHKGIVRKGNEDRVSIMLNTHNKFKKINPEKSTIKSCSIFSVFDGHGGVGCSNFLKEQYHKSLLKDLDIEGDIRESIKPICNRLDQEFLRIAMKNGDNFAGSTANTVIVLDRKLVILNTGDTRSVISKENGKEVIEASLDHKPDKESEFIRILNNGGELYRLSSNKMTGQTQSFFVNTLKQLKKVEDYKNSISGHIFGPWRIKPGGLSVARSFGDLESKTVSFGNVSGPVTCQPEIFEYDLNGLDFVFIACKLISRWSIR